MNSVHRETEGKVLMSLMLVYLVLSIPGLVCAFFGYWGLSDEYGDIGNWDIIGLLLVASTVLLPVVIIISGSIEFSAFNAGHYQVARMAGLSPGAVALFAAVMVVLKISPHSYGAGEALPVIASLLQISAMTCYSIAGRKRGHVFRPPR